MIELSIIIVSYNVKDILDACLQSIIQNTASVSYEIIIIDNDSKDGTVYMLGEKYSSIKVIANKENYGFAKANNQGIKMAKGEAILLLNPDTIVLGNSIYKMLKFMNSREDIGIIGPKLYINVNKEYHPSIRKFTRPEYIVLLYLPLSGFVLSVYNNFIIRKNRTRFVDWLVGAALLIKRDALNRVGLLDEKYFMYSEEEDLCLRVHEIGYKVCYFPDAEIVHLKGKSSRKFKVESCRYFWRSKFLFLRSYYGSFRVSISKVFLIQLLKIKIMLRIEGNKEYYGEIIKIVSDL